MKKVIGSILFITTATIGADIAEGEKIYKAYCAICHTIDGGSAMGPDFNIVSYTRKKNELTAYIKDPNSNFKRFGYSANAMPTLPLKEDEITAVAEYVSSLQPFKKWMKK